MLTAEEAGDLVRREVQGIIVLPVLFMSGYSNGLLGSTHVLDPEIAFIEKPFTADDLLRRVSSVLSSAATRS